MYNVNLCIGPIRELCTNGSYNEEVLFFSMNPTYCMAWPLKMSQAMTTIEGDKLEVIVKMYMLHSMVA